MKECSIVILSYHNVRVPFPSAHSLYTVQTSIDLSRIVKVFFYANKGDDDFNFRSLYGADLSDSASFYLRTARMSHKGLAGVEKRITALKDICMFRGNKLIAYVTQATPLQFFLFLKKVGFKIRILVEPHSENEAWSKSDFEGVDGIIFTSRTLQRKLTQRYSISANIPQKVFYHRVRSPISDKLSVLASTRENYCVGYIGGLEEWKGVDTIIEALRYLPENVTAHFIGGELSGQTRLLSMANELGVEKRVRFTGRVPQGAFVEECRDIDAFILPLLESEKGSLPLKLFDYMYLGKPIVASDQESIREILTNSSALFSPPGSDKGLAEQIKILVNNPSLGIDLSVNAYNALKSYTIDKWLGDMLDLLRQI
jgi:glycosyltransferase involved in cell wall biosynthesis